MFTLLRLPFALGILTLFSPGLDQVRIEHRTGLAYEMRMTRTMSMRAGEASMSVDGSGLPTELWDVNTWVPDRDDVETVVLRNVVRKVEEGRPVEVVREFVELTMQMTVMDETTAQTGALEGKQLVLERGADGGVAARVAEASEPVKPTIDKAYLEGHLLEHGIYRLMPEGEVEQDESWTPDADAVRELLLSPGPQYYDVATVAELPGLLEEAAEMTAEMTSRERVKLDGVECYRLELGVQMQAEIGKLPKEFSTGDQGEEGSLRVESEHRGELWIAVESRFPVKFEMESEWTFNVEVNIEQDREEERLEFQFKMELTANNTSSRVWEILE